MVTSIEVPKVNYNFVSSDGRNIFREKFGSLSDKDWISYLVRSIQEPLIEDVQFPAFPDADLQNRIHGNYGPRSIREAGRFYQFCKENTYKSREHSQKCRLLDFGAGWGRIVRPFMRDFEYSNMYGFEPDFLFCAIARQLNPYITIFSGTTMPSGILPKSYFDLVVGWSIFSHLSPKSASAWLSELSSILRTGGWCVLTTWGLEFLERLQREELAKARGEDIHWYSEICIRAAGSIDDRIEDFKKGEFVWFTSGKSDLYGEAFLSETVLRSLIAKDDVPLEVTAFDSTTLSQVAFVLRKVS